MFLVVNDIHIYVSIINHELLLFSEIQTVFIGSLDIIKLKSTRNTIAL